MGPLALGQHASIEVVHHIEARDAHHGLILRGIDRIALAGFLGAVKGGQCADDSEQANKVVGRLRECGHGSSIGEAVHLHIARKRLADGVEARAAYVAGVARLAKARNMHNDERRINLPQRLVAHAPLVHLAATETVNQNVGVFKQFVEQLTATAMAHVHAQRSGVATIHARTPTGEHRVRTARVATFGILDANNIGAQIAQHSASKRPSNCLRKIKNLHALQRAKWFERFFCHVSSSLHVDTEGKAKTMPEAGRAVENASPYAQKPSKHARRKRASSYAARVSPNRRTMLGGLGPYRFGGLRERLRQAFASEQNRASAAPARLSFEGRMTNRRNPAPLTFTLASGKTGHRHQARHNCSKRRKPPDRSIIR